MILRRMFDATAYLVVADNWDDFLAMVGFTPEDWDRCRHLPEPQV